MLNDHKRSKQEKGLMQPLKKRPTAPRAASSPLTRWSIRLAIAAAFAIAALAGVLIGSSLGRPSRRSGAVANRAKQIKHIQQEVRSLLAGIPQHGNTLGQPTAPVTLQFYGDLECMDAKMFAVSFLPAIIHSWVRTNIVKIQYRSLETDTLWPNVFVDQQSAALAAGEQNKLWDFVETFYHEQGLEYTRYVTGDFLDGIASQVPGLSLTQWARDRTSRRLYEQVVNDNNTARALKMHVTPSFLLGRTGGRTIKLSGYALMETPNPAGEMRKLKYPEPLIDTNLLKEAIGRLP